MIAITKIITLLAWLAILVNCFQPFAAPLDAILQWTGVGLLVAHVLEMLIFLPKANKAGGSKIAHALQLLVFGYAHNMAMDQTIAAKNA